MAGRPAILPSLLARQLADLSLSDDETELPLVKDEVIYPTTAEIFAEKRPKILPNIVDGPYPSLEKYLKIQYDLLREDFIGPLRSDLTNFEKYGNKNALQNIKFHKVVFLRKGAKHEKSCYYAHIVSQLDQNLRATGGSKRLIPGSFVLFYYENLRDVVCGKIEDSENIFKYKRFLVSLHPDTVMDFDKTYTMIEYTVFFEPYHCALKVLKGMSRDTFPMERYVVELNLSVNRPSYRKRISTSTSDLSTFNKSQSDAFQNALNKEFVLIQGPPGTGKTFLGLEIVKNLLKTTSEYPLLVVTYKNHALDQFLEGLLDDTKDIIRFGAQSKNPKVSKLTAKHQRNEQNDEFRNRTIDSCYGKYADAETRLKQIGSHLEIINTGEVVIQISILPLPVSLGANWNQLKNYTTNIEWLLFKTKDGGDLQRETLSLIHPIMKNKTILLFMSTIKTLRREINDAINDVEVNSTSIRTRTKLGEFTDEKLEKLKTFVDNIDTGKLKGYMSTLPPLHINQLTADEYEDPFKLPLPKRWQIYKTFLKGHVDKLHVKIDSAIADYKKAYMRFDSVSSPDNIRLMKKMKVIGMTTTCAARMRDSLESVKFPIVVIEEAAEVLESHVISAVTKDCKHLILIGDHKQLRPAVADFEVETKYRLGVSLFERMVANGVECHTLDVQHRMRPEISSLIVPYIYPTLKDHESVKKYPDVRGVAGNMFFLHHEQPESNSGECSKENRHEADFLLKFAEYLLQNGYKPEEITILSAYLGQVTTLHRKRRSCSHPGVQQIPIKSVDDYQGEENKIILLSLVRNNEESKIGFLSNEKRVCVALSRAREGLYIMGNIKHLTSRSRLWKDIEHTLISQNDVGPKISLKCQLHNRITHVDSCKDFGHLEQGGCRRKCMKELDCGHVCPQQCHGRDIGHIAEYFCREKCERYPCRAHPKVRCTSLCSMECARCEASIDHKLTCGHLAKCYMFTLDEDRIGSLKDDSHCEEVVDMKLNCNHNKILKCYLKFDSLEKKCHECTNKTKKHVRFTKNTRL